MHCPQLYLYLSLDSLGVAVLSTELDTFCFILLVLCDLNFIIFFFLLFTKWSYLLAAIELQENPLLLKIETVPTFFYVFKTQLSVVRFMYYTDVGK